MLRKFCLCEAFLREEMALLLAAARGGGTDWASSVMSASRLRGSAAQNACATFYSALEDRILSGLLGIARLTGVENSSMEVSPSQGEVSSSSTLTFLRKGKKTPGCPEHSVVLALGRTKGKL